MGNWGIESHVVAVAVAVAVDRFLVEIDLGRESRDGVSPLLSFEACARNRPNSISHPLQHYPYPLVRSSLMFEAVFLPASSSHVLILSTLRHVVTLVVVAGDLFRDRLLPRGRGVPRLARSPPTPLGRRRRRRFGRTSQIQVSYYRAGYRQRSATREGGKCRIIRHILLTV